MNLREKKEYEKEKRQFLRDFIIQFVSMFFTVGSLLWITAFLNIAKTLIPEGQNNYLIFVGFLAFLIGVVIIKFYDWIFKIKK